MMRFYKLPLKVCILLVVNICTYETSHIYYQVPGTHSGRRTWCVCVWGGGINNPWTGQGLVGVIYFVRHIIVIFGFEVNIYIQDT